MTLHRLGVDKSHLGGLVPQYLRKLVHRAFADAHVVRLDRGTGDMYGSLSDHIHQLSRRGLRRLTMRAHMHVRDLPEYRITITVQLLPTLVGIAVQPPRLARSMASLGSAIR